MKKKKIMIVTIALAFCLLAYGAYSTYRNYQLGAEMNRTASVMSTQCQNLSDGIDYLESELQKGRYDITDIGSMRNLYDLSISSVRSSFGYDNMPMLDDVRSDLTHQFEELFRETMDDEDLIAFFTDQKEMETISALRNQLDVLKDTLVDFTERYEKMSDWERCFTSWENERKTLSEKLRTS